MSGIWEKLIAVVILAAFFFLIYSAITKKTLKETWNSLIDWLGGTNEEQE